jgi:N-acetylmuramoyl-L-alanine amidase
MVVVIDPGHGGKDPGAVSKGIQEKDVVLGIGLKLGRYISDSYPDVKVVFTRNTDVFVPLIDRSRIANKNKADLFISLHANTCGTPSLRGTETFCLGIARLKENLDVAKKENSVIKLEDDYSVTYEGFDPDSNISNIMFEMAQEAYLDQSLSFADDIQHQFKSRLEGSNRGVKQAGFLVLRLSAMPSVLVETGFVSNQAEASYLKSDDGQYIIANSIFNAFRKFKTKSSGTSTPEHQIVNSKFKSDTSAHSTSSEKKQENKPEEKVEIKIEKQKTLAEEKIIVPEKINTEKTPNPSVDTPLSNGLATNVNGYYSVQIGANTIEVEPSAANFKGLKEVRREKTDKYYRYYIGTETALENITPILQKIKLKFPQAFIVYFIDGKRTIINN